MYTYLIEEEGGLRERGRRERRRGGECTLTLLKKKEG